MRILVHEFVSGGGLHADTPHPPLLREGLAMVQALTADLQRIGEHDVAVTVDPRIAVRIPAGVQPVVIDSSVALDVAIELADAVWIIAPETDGVLEALVRKVQQHGRTILGSTPAAVRQAADKMALAEVMRIHGVPYPETRRVASVGEACAAARDLGLPVVIKPRRGAGCAGVSFARTFRSVARAFVTAQAVSQQEAVLMQRVISGVAGSVSVVCGAGSVVPIAVNEQLIEGSLKPRYRGGLTPLEHPSSDVAASLAVRACEAVGGLAGFVGVDVVLNETGAVVIEINPRLTTAYIGARAALDINVAVMLLAACEGLLPVKPPAPYRTITFSASGRIRVLAERPNHTESPAA